MATEEKEERLKKIFESMDDKVHGSTFVEYLLEHMTPINGVSRW